MFEHAFDRLKPLARVILHEELDRLEDSVVACHQALAACGKSNLSLEKEIKLLKAKGSNGKTKQARG